MLTPADEMRGAPVAHATRGTWSSRPQLWSGTAASVWRAAQENTVPLWDSTEARHAPGAPSAGGVAIAKRTPHISVMLLRLELFSGEIARRSPCGSARTSSTSLLTDS